MNLPIHPVILCSHLKGKTPGKLSSDLLRPIEGGGKLHHCAADAYEAMRTKAKAEGIELKPTSLSDTYRSYDTQLAGFKQRYSLEDTGTGKTRHFENKVWYLKPKMAPLAAPGTSKHNLGIAVDIASANGDRLKWLQANAESFGFSWEVVPEEPWHLRYVAGDKIPAAVVDHLASKKA